ncbi:MAG TPA: site-2 protease family protein [Isosphaeraceae bacterium]|jgi:Zn-dependent protease
MLEATVCLDCGSEIAPALLVCPGCGRLVHAARLKQLAEEAARAAAPTEALVAWRSALELLPPRTRQREVIEAKIAELGRQVDASPTPARPAAPAKGSPRMAGAAGLGAVGLLAWKFKAIALLVLTKGKLLLLGLTKASTFTSMALSLGVYGSVFGWPLALGLVVSIYIHEMGHVAALLRYGVKATAPLFLPGIGAVIRLRQSLGDPRQDARVGLAGPVWGLGAAGASALVWVAGGPPIWAAIARLGAALNLFNLIPIGTLDGGRAFRALDRTQRWLAILAIAGAWSLSTDPFAGMVLFLGLLAGFVAATAGRAAPRPDPVALVTYTALAFTLTFLAGIDVPDLPRAGG